MRERIRKTPQEIELDRVFAPGRLRHQWLAAAYEQLVPFRCPWGCQKRQESHPRIREEYRWVG